MKDLSLLTLSMVVLAAYFYTGFVIITHQTAQSIDPQIAMLIGSVYGSVGSLAGVVVAYWFGSSKGSSDKDQTITDLTKPPSNPQVQQ
jgi:hypothetical protein